MKLTCTLLMLSIVTRVGGCVIAIGGRSYRPVWRAIPMLLLQLLLVVNRLMRLRS